MAKAKKSISKKTVKTPQKAIKSKKKSLTQKTTPKVSSAKLRLEKELVVLMKDIDADGLLFLVQQAHVLVHNRRVDEINDEMEKAKSKTKKSVSSSKASGETVRGSTVEIEQNENGKMFYLIIDGRRHFLDPHEMKRIIAPCLGAKDKIAAKKNVYNFMNTERNDILMEHSIGSMTHPFFDALIAVAKVKFKIKK